MSSLEHFFIGVLGFILGTAYLVRKQFAETKENDLLIERNKLEQIKAKASFEAELDKRHIMLQDEVNKKWKQSEDKIEEYRKERDELIKLNAQLTARVDFLEQERIRSEKKQDDILERFAILSVEHKNCKNNYDNVFKDSQSKTERITQLLSQYNDCQDKVKILERININE